MQVLFFLSDRINGNIKISLFCHKKYEIFLCCGHKIKVCVECSRFSIGFRHKQLKYNTWKPGKKIVLHSVIYYATTSPLTDLRLLSQFSEHVTQEWRGQYRWFFSRLASGNPATHSS